MTSSSLKRSLAVCGTVAFWALAGPREANAGDKDVNVVNTASNPVPVAPQGTTTVAGTVAVSNLPATQTVSGTVAVSNLPSVQSVKVTGSRVPLVLMYEPLMSPIPFIGVNPDGSVAVYSAWQDMIPAGKALMVRDIEYTVRGPAAYANQRLYFAIHLGALGQGTWSFRTSLKLDATAEGSGAHYLSSGMLVTRGAAITPFPFVYPNNGSGDATMDLTLRGELVDADTVQ